MVEFGAIATPTRSRWVSNNHITRCHRRFEFVGVQVAVRGSENQLKTEGLGPQDPGWAAQHEWGRSAAIVRGTWGQYVAVCSVSNSPLTHNQHQPFRNPFENKVWEVYFSKEVCSFVIIVDYVSACICIYIVVSWLYNIGTEKFLVQPKRELFVYLFVLEEFTETQEIICIQDWIRGIACMLNCSGSFTSLLSWGLFSIFLIQAPFVILFL